MPSKLVLIFSIDASTLAFSLSPTNFDTLSAVGLSLAGNSFSIFRVSIFVLGNFIPNASSSIFRFANFEALNISKSLFVAVPFFILSIAPLTSVFGALISVDTGAFTSVDTFGASVSIFGLDISVLGGVLTSDFFTVSVTASPFFALSMSILVESIATSSISCKVSTSFALPGNNCSFISFLKLFVVSINSSPALIFASASAPFIFSVYFMYSAPYLLTISSTFASTPDLVFDFIFIAVPSANDTAKSVNKSLPVLS